MTTTVATASTLYMHALENVYDEYCTLCTVNVQSQARTKIYFLFVLLSVLCLGSLVTPTVCNKLKLVC